MKGKHLITTSEWFYAPDGISYRAVWGDIEILEDSCLGVKTNRNSANWYAKVKGEKDYVIIAGCQIHYAIKTDKRPNTEEVLDFTVDNNKDYYKRPSHIYIPE